MRFMESTATHTPAMLASPLRSLDCGCTLQLTTPGPGMVDIRHCPEGERLADIAQAVKCGAHAKQSRSERREAYAVWDARWDARNRHLTDGLFAKYGDRWGI